MNLESQQALLQLQMWDMEEKEIDQKHLTKLYMGATMLSKKTIRKHLRQYKRDFEFKKSILVRLIDIIDVFYSFWVVSTWDGT